VGPILRAISPQTIPIPSLIDAARGVGFAQIVREADGVVRKYPTFIRHDHPAGGDGQDTYLFPSIGLAMACDYLQAPLKNLRLKPGEYVEIPDALLPDGTRKNLRVPVNEKGEMIINWAGDYKDSFRHFPYSSLIRLAEQRTLEEIKKFLSTRPQSIFRNPSELSAAVRDAFPSVRDSATYIAYIYGARWYETLIEEGEIEEFEPQLFEQLFGLSREDAPALYETQKEVFENVRFHHAMLELVSERRGISMSEAVSRLGGPEEAAENSYMTIRQLLARGGPTPADRPLYFLSPVMLEGKQLSLDELKGGVFFYGLTATGTHDLNPMPFSPRYPMVGAVANVFNTIVTGQFIIPLGDIWRLPLFLAIGLFTGYILSSRTTIRGSMFTLLFLVAYLLFAYWLFAERRIWIQVVGPTGTILLSDVAIVWYKFSTAEKKRKFIKSAFEHYMNPAVVDQIAANPDMLELGGKEMVLTAFFSDVGGFTTISEQLTPHQLVELLNEYLTAMTDIVLKYDGLLDKYEGDAIMAVFGAPIHFPDHATKACYAALEMQERLREMRAKWKSEGRPELKARIGLNTGSMIVGNMGSLTRFDYTVMGDSVNLASRLEGVNKQYSTDIMISQFTLELCKPDVVVREIDLIRVQGKTEPVTIYEVLARVNDGLPEDMKSVVEHYSRGLEAYRRRVWETGIEEFRRALEIKPDDGPSLTYLKRCSEYLSAPPSDDWDGVYIMITK
jgi:class 3 adenylate cyclase